MSLSRKELLDEMGLSPQWVVRETPVVREQPAAKVAAPAPRSPVIEAPVVPPVSVRPGPIVSPSPVANESGQVADAADVAQMDWPTLRQTILDCRVCGLCAKRTQAVPGVGDEQADWLFIGEGPGAEEDARGEPFVGQAGRLLDAMLAAIDLARDDNVYIANAVKCRPPGNRTPEAAEMAACWPYLKRQIALVRPKVIVLLGKAAVHAVLGEDGSLASMRGKTLSYRDGDSEVPVVVTYHPAYLLRNLPDKAKAWEDLCRARRVMRGLASA